MSRQGGPWSKAYRGGLASGRISDDHCPHACGSKDWEWWWNGYWDGVAEHYPHGMKATAVNASD